ncbi:MAG: endolytic transglycosylase MltG [Hymenobacter sp.]
MTESAAPVSSLPSLVPAPAAPVGLAAGNAAAERVGGRGRAGLPPALRSQRAGRRGRPGLPLRPAGVGLKAVLDSLQQPGMLLRPNDLVRVARWWGLGTAAHPVQPGRYTLPAGLGNLALLRLLASGRRDTLAFTLKPFHYLPQLPRRAGRQLSLDTAQLHKLLIDNAYLTRRYGLDTATVRTLFIPGALRLFWPTPATAFLDSVAARHRRFWNQQRLAEADSLKMSPVQVAVLASIVQRETAQPLDRPRIAGVYLNRLRRGQPLQADPTLLWPLHGLGTRKRVLNVDKKVDSPYNTYRHKGLPPGPITTPYPRPWTRCCAPPTTTIFSSAPAPTATAFPILPSPSPSTNSTPAAFNTTWIA